MPDSLPQCGVIYAVTGEKFLREAEQSAASLRRHMPSLPIAIFTDRTDADPTLFDIIRSIASPAYSAFDKQFGFREVLFEKTLFLDSDTFITRPFPEIFTLLDRFDMAATREFWSGIKPSGPSATTILMEGSLRLPTVPPLDESLTIGLLWPPSLKKTPPKNMMINQVSEKPPTRLPI